MLGRMVLPTTATDPDPRSVVAFDFLYHVLTENVEIDGFLITEYVLLKTHSWLQASANAPQHSSKALRSCTTPDSGGSVEGAQRAFKRTERISGRVFEEMLDAYVEQAVQCSAVDAYLVWLMNRESTEYVATFSATDHKQFVERVDIDAVYGCPFFDPMQIPREEFQNHIEEHSEIRLLSR